MPQFVEDGLVVDEAVDDGGHRHAEDLAAVVGDPGALGHVAEVLHAGQVGQVGQVALVEERQRGIEGPAGDQVARGAAFQLGVECGVVFCRGGGREDDLDAGIFGLEGRNDDPPLKDR